MAHVREKLALGAVRLFGLLRRLSLQHPRFQQRLLRHFAFGDVPDYLTKTAQLTTLIIECGGDLAGPEAGAVLPYTPAFVLNASLFGGDDQFLARLVLCYRFRRVKP